MDNVDQAVLRMYEEGRNRTYIKNALNLGSEDAVTRILKRYGKSYRKDIMDAATKRKEKVVELYKDGFSMSEISQKMNISISYVQGILDKADVLLNDPVGASAEKFSIEKQIDWTRTVNNFRVKVFGKEPFPMPTSKG